MILMKVKSYRQTIYMFHIDAVVMEGLLHLNAGIFLEGDKFIDFDNSDPFKQ